MNKSQAFVAGVTGGIVMTVLLAIGRAMGLEANLEMMLGTMFGIEPGFGAWVVGLILHLAISGLIGMAYAYAFEAWLHRANWQAGAALSIPHLIIGGLFMALVPGMHPLIPETLAAPGAFLSNFGASGVFAFILSHIIYGSIVGGVYDMRQRRREQYKTTTYDDRSKVA